MSLIHVMGHWVVGSHPTRLDMSEDDGVIYFSHGGDTVSLSLTEGQAQDLIGLLTIIKNRKGFREMEEE